MLLRGLLTDNDSICAIQVDDSLHIYVVIRTGTELVFGLDEDNYMFPGVTFCSTWIRAAIRTGASLSDLIPCDNLRDRSHIGGPSYAWSDYMGRPSWHTDLVDNLDYWFADYQRHSQPSQGTPHQWFRHLWSRCRFRRSQFPHESSTH